MCLQRHKRQSAAETLACDRLSGLGDVKDASQHLLDKRDPALSLAACNDHFAEEHAGGTVTWATVTKARQGAGSERDGRKAEKHVALTKSRVV